MILAAWRARLGYQLARRLLRWRWAVAQPRLWQWMQGQYARRAALGDRCAQSFYGHLLLFRGQGLGAGEEGLRLLRLAAAAGDAKAAYQLGVKALEDSPASPGDPNEALRWWRLAAEAGHPLACRRLAQLLAEGAPGLAADTQQAAHWQQQAQRLGL